MHDSEASRPYTDPDNDERPFSNTQNSSVQPLIDRSETLQLGTESRCFYTVGFKDLRSHYKSGIPIYLKLNKHSVWIMEKKISDV